MRELLFFTPEHKYLVWGKESWTISAHINGDVYVSDGSYTGKKLSRLWKEKPELFGKKRRSRSPLGSFPLLVKIITADDDLSIQVHPDDSYAFENENGSLGKTECWYILDCNDDAHLVNGHNAKDKAELKAMINENRFDELIREIPVKAGDFIQINPGTIHAIKGGIRLLEIQQSSDITYRLYDYDRLIGKSPRQLHLKQSLDVITCPDLASGNLTTAMKRPVNQLNELVKCEYYTVWEAEVSLEMTLNQKHPFMIVCVISGEGQTEDKKIKKGDHFIIPHGYGDVTFSGEMKLILAIS
ncbi:MAG: mannose-6-phosphate isomerase, class I [Lachnospiraceae bacterium]|nr:mannose-6-phosphate isomerase, class I [Lachnospiraceae bacterium]